MFTGIDDNGLSFIETSAFDSSNVETAFQNILTGTWANSLVDWIRNLQDCVQQGFGG
jgi:hypothetical protein